MFAYIVPIAEFGGFSLTPKSHNAVEHELLEMELRVMMCRLEVNT